MTTRFHFRTLTVRTALPVFFCLIFAAPAPAQRLPWSQRAANSTIRRWPAGRVVAPGAPWKWNYELGVLLNGMNATWYNTAEGQDYHCIQNAIDSFVTSDGSIPTYHPAAKELDNLALGRSLLLLYRVTQQKKYYEAATLLRRQLAAQPRNASGGFWHKQKYPNQMWLDGLYMGEPFYKSPAASLLRDKQGIVIARAKYGEGTVVAAIDPWLYNEYTDHRKVHPAQQNFAAGQEFTLWLLDQTGRGARASLRQ